MNVKIVVGAVALLAEWLMPGETRAASPPLGRKPNIIFILADDLGYADLGCYGQNARQAQDLPAIATPEIDKLANEGMRFAQCYSGHTVCAPSRCSLMTGYHTGHTRVRQNFGSDGNRVALQPSDFTVAELLKQANYTTGLVGKWGLGDETPELLSGVPNNQGFDYFYGYLDQADAHYYYPTHLWENHQQVPTGGEYSHDLFTTKAINFIQQCQDRPFFLYLAYTIPHADFVVPDLGPYANANWPQQEYKTYAAMIWRMDYDIGRIMTLLKSLGLDNHTIVFFASDNGPASGQVEPSKVDFFDSNGPFRGVKTDLSEGGIRVPMIVRWPGTIAAQAVSEDAWAFCDVMPTFADIVGLSPPTGIDGISVLGTLLGMPRERREYLYWEDSSSSLTQAVRVGNWKAWRQKSNNLPPLDDFRLYNLAQDIGEITDVAHSNPLVAARISQIMGTCRTDSSAYYSIPYQCSGGASLEGVTLVRYVGRTGCGALTTAVEGAGPYTDGSHTIAAGGLPGAYRDGVLVQWANNDRTLAISEYIDLFMAYDAKVSVAYRTNANKPSWWTGGYAQTSDTLTVSGFTGGNRTFEVRSRTVPAGSELILPGNYYGGGNADAGYIVIVNKDTSATTSPTIAIHPTNQTVQAGHQVTFTAAGCGTWPLGLQWQKRIATSAWSNLPGATGSSYSISAAALADNGSSYRCIVSNAFGNVTSDEAAVTVVPKLDPPFSLLADWPLDETSGTAATDVSWQGHDGLLQGTTRVPGRVGGALSFDGIHDCVSTSWQGITAANPRTVCLWVKCTTASGKPLLARGDDRVTGGTWHLLLNANPADGTVGAIRTDVNGGYAIGSISITDGNWHHVASVLPETDVTTVLHYVDGNLDGVSGSRPLAVNTVAGFQSVTLGAGTNGGAMQYFAGCLDEIQVHDRALSEETIRLLAGPPARLMPGDFDRDGDVDQEDFGCLQSCLAGPGSYPPAGCSEADFDGDLDVDNHDLDRFSECFNGPNREPPCW
jgi:arylsulfatase A-like enzyme